MSSTSPSKRCEDRHRDESLLETIVAQFVAREAHPAPDIRQFEELALGLIDRVDAAAALRLTLPLCGHSDTPRTILARRRALAAGDALREADGGAADRGVWGDAVASRLTASDLSALRERAADLTIKFDAFACAALVRAARDDRALARILLDRDDLDIDPAPLFLAATRLERLAIVLEACRAALVDGYGETRPADPDFVARFEQAAIDRDRAAMAAMVADALECNPDRARDIVEDRSGEALALLLVTLGFDATMGARIFLCADRTISQNAGRVQKLMALMRATPQSAAAAVVAAMTGETRGGGIAAPRRVIAREETRPQPRRMRLPGGVATRLDRSA
jgi:hypothetical protein